MGQDEGGEIVKPQGSTKGVWWVVGGVEVVDEAEEEKGN